MNNKPTSKSQHWVLFFLQPFLATVYYTVKHFRKPYAKNILWAFVVFYGFTFAIGQGNQGSDIVRYVAEIQRLYQHPMTWSSALNYFIGTGEIDILRTILAILISRFTGMQIVITGVYAFVFGYFFSRNLWFVLNRLEGRLKKVTVLLLLCTFLIIPIWNLNGFRFWTAAHVYVFGLLPYLVDNKKKSLWWAFLSPLIHFSFALPVIILVLYLMFKNHTRLYFVIFVISVFTTSINIETVNNFVENYTPEMFQEQTSAYRSENKVKEFRQGELRSDSAWYALYFGKVLFWSVMALLTVVYFHRKRLKNLDLPLEKLLNYALLFFTFANLMSSFPSGGRFLYIAALLTLCLLALYYQNVEMDKQFKTMSKLLIPLFILFIVVAVRIGFYSFSVNTILGNPITAIIGPRLNLNMPLNDIIK